VFLEFHDRSVHFQALLPPGPDERAPVLVVRSQPESDPILVPTDRKDGPANFVPVLVQRLPDDRQDGEEPPLVAASGPGILLGYRQDELPPLDVLRVLPHGEDALAEDVVVRVDGYLGGRLQVVEDAPEGFDRVEGTAVDQVVLPGLVGVGEAGIVEPDGPRGVQRDGFGGYFLGDDVGGTHFVTTS